MTISFNHKSKLSTVGTGSYVFRHYGVGGGGSLTYTYTGTVEERDITFEGTDYKILMLTTDGDLSFSRPVTCDIWACGGGSNGLSGAKNANGGYGGAGAYCDESDGISIQSINVIIGPANTESGTVITGDTSLTAAGVHNNKNGGTGGGGCDGVSSGTSARGTGDKKSKYPFLDTVNFQCHCAGGGGGARAVPSSKYRGGAGGTNGGNGSNYTSSSTSSVSGGNGGTYGGGRGGSADAGSATAYAYNPSAATFYGSGGGGGASATSNYTGSGYRHAKTNGAAGYQGVCYIRIPASEF